MKSFFDSSESLREDTLGAKDFFFSIWLQLKHRWLLNRSNQLDATIKSIVTPVNGGRCLFSKLIHKFTYVDKSVSSKRIADIANHIINIWKCNQTNTLIMAVTKKDNPHPDGALKMIYDLQVALGGWNRSKLINHFDVNNKYIKKGYDVIICDDFIGSGETINKRIVEIREKMSKEANLFIVALAGMKDAKRRYLSKQNLHIYVPCWLDKGIIDNFSEGIMFNMEALLSTKYLKETKSKVSMGYGKAGSLYYNEDYRIPNSVYPIFWWGKLADGKPFNSLFRRP